MITNSKEILSQDEKTALRERIQDICKKAVSELMDPTSQMSDEERVQYEQKIFQKLKQGKRLSSAEMNYLQIHNPTMYQKALRVQNAKERLQTRLEHCRSKEEANDVIAMEMSAVSDKDSDREYMLAGLQETAKDIVRTATTADFRIRGNRLKKRRIVLIILKRTIQRIPCIRQLLR